ncbi:hypothetical protein [Streptomyces sp. NA02950]|nr:hypothetical protein [Streptomyces sp. NA02950]
MLSSRVVARAHCVLLAFNFLLGEALAPVSVIGNAVDARAGTI